MAYVENIWIYDSNKQNKSIAVFVKLAGIGDTRLNVPLPEAMYNVISAIAQNAADMHELQAKALILAEQHKPESPEVTQENYKGE